MPAIKRKKNWTPEDEVDDAGFGQETRYIFERDDDEFLHSEEENPSILTQEKRLRLRPDINLEGKEYRGKKSKRNEAFPDEEKYSKTSKKKHQPSPSESEYSESESEENDDDEEESDGDEKVPNEAEDEVEALAREYSELKEQEETLLKTLKEHGEEDIRKGQAVRNQKELWDKALEIRISLQKAFSSSNQLPQEPVRSHFCKFDERIDEAYSELVASAENTIDCLSSLQQVFLEKNNIISEITEKETKNSRPDNDQSDLSLPERSSAWEKIDALYNRITPFRDTSIDKWHRKTHLSAGAAAMKSKLHAFNKSISQQVSAYMRDPTSVIKRMELAPSSVQVLGSVDHIQKMEDSSSAENPIQEADPDGDPELLDDSEFYQQLLQEFLESNNPTYQGTNIYEMKKMRNKKRKVVDRRASKSRKIRYNVHEKILNFMAPEPMVLPPMTPKLFSDLFGEKKSKAQ